MTQGFCPVSVGCLLVDIWLSFGCHFVNQTGNRPETKRNRLHSEQLQQLFLCNRLRRAEPVAGVHLSGLVSGQRFSGRLTEQVSSSQKRTLRVRLAENLIA